MISEFLSTERVAVISRVAVLVLAGLPFVLYLGSWTKKYVEKRFSAQQGMVAGKAVQYIGFLIVIVTVFYELGFSLTPLLGAAGIVGIAVGFASQTSVSNIISGLFLIAEKPFQVGDMVNINDVTGFVLSVDILSVKIRTFDNKYIRIPNENIIKSQVTNITRFPIRRIDINIGVAYKEDIEHVREVLKDIAAKDPLCLQEPEPIVVFNGYGDSSINFLFAVWTIKENWLTVNNSIKEKVKVRFDEEGIEIPFPHRTLYTGLATEPFPIQIVNTNSTLKVGNNK
jgi:small-conductance mechanosensitive channel